MDERPILSRKTPAIPRVGLAAATFVALALVLAGCAAATTSPLATATGGVERGAASAGAASSQPSGALAGGTAGTVGAAGAATGDQGVSSGGTGVAAGGAAVPPVAGSGAASVGVAYPNLAYPLAGAIAPEGTILASGTGTAQVRADRSDLTAAREKATAAALADARTQADGAAAAASVHILGVYSMAVAISDANPGPIAYGCPILPPFRAGGGSSDGGTTVPGATAVPAAPASPGVCRSFAPTASQVVATVSVAYKFG